MATIISSKTTGGGGISLTGDSSGILQLASADGTTAVTIDASQNVGIGTSSPAKKVDVVGTYRAQIDPTNTAFYGASLTLAGDQGSSVQAGARIIGGYESGFGLLFQTSTGAQAGLNSDPSLLTYTTKMKIDSSGNVLVSSNGGGLGYNTGSGGAVTQLTSKTTGVTLNKITGRISTSNSALAANTNTSFIVTNSTVQATDVIIINVWESGISLDSYQVSACPLNGGGGFYVLLRNVTAGSLSQVIVLNFAVIRGAIA